MPSRIPSGPPVDPDRIKALIVSTPSTLEAGFRVLDIDLAAGRAGTIDILGIDRGGALTLLAVSSGDDLDPALIRLLDQQIWIADQSDLLRRIHEQAAVDMERPVRALLLSPAFTERFLRRLELLKQPVTALLARPVPAAGKNVLLIEDAAPIFGLAAAEPFAAPARPAEQHRVRPRAFEPRADREVAVPVTAELVVDQEGEADTLLDPFPEEAEPSDPFETLSTEELDEFERFERERRLRKRSPA